MLQFSLSLPETRRGKRVSSYNNKPALVILRLIMRNAPYPARTLSVATAADRKEIYSIRHQVYANELKQHAPNADSILQDSLDAYNHYIVAKAGDKVIGFISITPPAAPSFSVDKYFDRNDIPVAFDEGLFEVRLLTVTEAKRSSLLALVLMYAAFRWVQSHGGQYIIAIGRAAIMSMYQKAGLQGLGKTAVSGAVTYELCMAEVATLETMIKQNSSAFAQWQAKINWQLPFAFFAPQACYHGGSFFEAIGEDLQQPEKAKTAINADVLDAWFAPSPKVLQLLQENLSWLLQSSPPTHAAGMIKAIAQARGVPGNCLLPGAGSSDLIFLALTNLLNRNTKALILDPCYGEYVHVLEQVLQCRVTRFPLQREDDFVVDTTQLVQEIIKGYDFVVLVNPNSPTGQYVSRHDMEVLLAAIPVSTLVWIDETYIEYAGENESLEQLACQSENVIICKSMSKMYALSGVRAAYLCCSPHWIETLKPFSPPWAVSLPAQAAAITALADKPYYAHQYAETHRLRSALKKMLYSIGINDVIDGVANFLLFYLPGQYRINAFLKHCKSEHLYLRDVSTMGKSLGQGALRIAVKDEATNEKMVRIMWRAMKKMESGTTKQSTLVM